MYIMEAGNQLHYLNNNKINKGVQMKDRKNYAELEVHVNNLYSLCDKVENTHNSLALIIKEIESNSLYENGVSEEEKNKIKSCKSDIDYDGRIAKLV